MKKSESLAQSTGFLTPLRHALILALAFLCLSALTASGSQDNTGTAQVTSAETDRQSPEAQANHNSTTKPEPTSSVESSGPMKTQILPGLFE